MPPQPLQKNFREKCDSVIAITGAIDIVADSKSAYIIRNGVPMMSKITGSGCMLSAMTAAYITANPDDILQASAAAVCAMGLCGEKSLSKRVPAQCRKFYLPQLSNR